MRQFAFVEYDPEVGSDMAMVKTITEEGIAQHYWPYWYERMCRKYDKQYVDETYTVEDCIEDWVTINWAWEIADE